MKNHCFQSRADNKCNFFQLYSVIQRKFEKNQIMNNSIKNKTRYYKYILSKNQILKKEEEIGEERGE